MEFSLWCTVSPLYAKSFTTFLGEYFEPFYLELEFKGDKIEVSLHNLMEHAYHNIVHTHIQPSWHTIPVFIPLESLIEKYNKKEMNVRNYLCTLL